MELWILLAISAALTVVFCVLWVKGRKKPPQTIYIQKDLDSESKALLDQRAAKQAHELALQKEKELNEIQLQKEQALRALEIEIAEKREAELQTILAQREKHEKETFELYKSREQELTLQLQSKKDQIESQLIQLDTLLKNKELDSQSTIEAIESQIEIWKQRQSIAIEAFQDADRVANLATYNIITFSSTEMTEIKQLREVINTLSNPMPFRKAVYDIYYKNKIDDLVKRIVNPLIPDGLRRVSGIYKITEVKSGKTYVGQSVDIGNRWKQHAKRGCGADALTGNKLYPAMIELGVESFAFEVLEIIPEGGDLNFAEKYWQNFYKSREFGYSMK